MNLQRTYLAQDGWHSVYDDGTDILTLPITNDILGVTQEQVQTLQQMTDAHAASDYQEAHRLDYLSTDTHPGQQFVLSNDGAGNIPDTDFIGGRFGHWADIH